MKKLLGKFVSVSAIKAASDITEVEYRENQLPGTFSREINISLYMASSYRLGQV